MERIQKVSGMLVYVSCMKPVPAFQKKGAPPKPPEWKASVVITDEDLADDLDTLATELSTQISLKKVRTTAFEEIYHVEPPEDAGKNVWVFTLKKSTKKGGKVDAEDLPAKFQPKVLFRSGKTLTDITNSELVGNGSMGAISLAYFDMQNGSSISLRNVLVTDLVEYQQSDDEGEAGSEFEDDLEDDDDKPDPKKAPPKKKTKVEGDEFEEGDDKPAPKKATPAKKTVKKAEPEPEPEDDDDEGSIPF